MDINDDADTEPDNSSSGSSVDGSSEEENDQDNVCENQQENDQELQEKNKCENQEENYKNLQDKNTCENQEENNQNAQEKNICLNQEQNVKNVEKCEDKNSLEVIDLTENDDDQDEYLRYLSAVQNQPSTSTAQPRTMASQGGGNVSQFHEMEASIPSVSYQPDAHEEDKIYSNFYLPSGRQLKKRRLSLSAEDSTVEMAPREEEDVVGKKRKSVNSNSEAERVPPCCSTSCVNFDPEDPFVFARPSTSSCDDHRDNGTNFRSGDRYKFYHGEIGKCHYTITKRKPSLPVTHKSPSSLSPLKLDTINKKSKQLQSPKKKASALEPNASEASVSVYSETSSHPSSIESLTVNCSVPTDRPQLSVEEPGLEVPLDLSTKKNQSLLQDHATSNNQPFHRPVSVVHPSLLDLGPRSSLPQAPDLSNYQTSQPDNPPTPITLRRPTRSFSRTAPTQAQPPSRPPVRPIPIRQNPSSSNGHVQISPFQLRTFYNAAAQHEHPCISIVHHVFVDEFVGTGPDRTHPCIICGGRLFFDERIRSQMEMVARICEIHYDYPRYVVAHHRVPLVAHPPEAVLHHSGEYLRITDVFNCYGLTAENAVVSLCNVNFML